MLRPERMSKVSVTGSKAVMADVVETVHELHRLHLTDYDGSWEGFDNGDPVEGADEASERLVTVRGLESTLDLDDEHADPTYDFDPAELEERLASVRSEVNDLDDARQELRQQLREIEDRIDSMEPFARLNLDLDLLSGYDSIEIVVGEGEEAAVREAYEAAEEVRGIETFSGDGVVAAAVVPAEGVDPDDAASDPLVGVEFAELEVPEAEGQSDEYVDELRHEAEKVESELEAVESELENLTLDVGAFLLAAEEYLAIQVQKGEAPLQFATTDNSFVAEGWVPSAEVDVFESALREDVGDRIEFEELERAEYTRHGDVAHHDEVGGVPPEEAHGDVSAAVEPDEEEADDGQPAVADGGEPSAAKRSSAEPRSDGGVVTVDDEPPVIQDNPSPTGPFEVLTQAVNRPKYSEFDPTITLFLTFPLFFGFMIGDVGYGVVYALLGYLAYAKFDSDAVRQFGVVVIWCGALTVLFGILYGEIFGLHYVTEWLWVGGLGLEHAPIEKGLGPGDYAIGWLVVAVVAGWIQLNVGWLFDFVENYQLHSPKEALLESGSWLLLLNGMWVWIFSTHLEGQKPAFLFYTFDGRPFGLGFAGFPEVVGFVAIGAILAGVALLVIGPTHELPEVLQPFVHALSYTRLTAVLLSKAGMALVANMLYFGAYQDAEGGYHFMIDHGPEYVASHEGATMMFSGMFHGGLASQILGIPVLIVAHLVVLAIGVSAMLQAIRLEYVEFFGKFYEGGGKTFDPFGYDRDYTSDNDS